MSRTGEIQLSVIKEEAKRLYDGRQPLPLGTIAWYEGEKFKIKRSTYHRLTKVAREVACCPQAHDLWVDGGMLVDVTYDKAQYRLLKRATARALGAERTPQHDLLTWRLAMEFELSCAAAEGGRHRFNLTWEPRLGHTERPKRGVQGALYDLRPLGVHDSRFWAAYGKRNNAESHNQWYKDTFYHRGRAMRLDDQAQYLDQLAAASVINALTWSTFNQQQRLSQQHATRSGTTTLLD